MHADTGRNTKSQNNDRCLLKAKIWRPIVKLLICFWGSSWLKVKCSYRISILKKKEEWHSSRKGMPFFGLNSKRDFSCQALHESNEWQKGLCPRLHSSNRFSEGSLLCISVKPRDTLSKYNSKLDYETKILSMLFNFTLIQLPIWLY